MALTVQAIARMRRGRVSGSIFSARQDRQAPWRLLPERVIAVGRRLCPEDDNAARLSVDTCASVINEIGWVA